MKKKLVTNIEYPIKCSLCDILYKEKEGEWIYISNNLRFIFVCSKCLEDFREDEEE